MLFDQPCNGLGFTKRQAKARAELAGNGSAGDRMVFRLSLGDVVNEAVGEGNDTVISTSNYALTEGSEIETLQLVGSGLIGIGN